MQTRWLLLGMVVGLGGGYCTISMGDRGLAQNAPVRPDRDRFLPSPPAAPLLVPEEQPIIPIPVPPPPTVPNPALEDPTPFPIQQIQVIGATQFEDEIRAITQPLEGRDGTIRDLNTATEAITQLYLDEGYLSSRAVLEPQRIRDGVVTIRVIEGVIEAVVIEGTQRLRPSYVRDRAQLGITTPFNIRNLENQLRLLRTDPLIANLSPRLRAGSQENSSILVIRVAEAYPVTGSVSLDNYSPPSTGSERLGAAVRYLNLTGVGDSLGVAYYRSTTGGSRVFSGSYRLPLNAREGVLQVGAELANTEVTDPQFRQFDIDGSAERYDLTFRQPLVRSLDEEFALSLGFSYQNGQTFTFDQPTPFGIGPDEDGVSRTSVIRFSQDYVRRDRRRSGGWSVRSQFNLGTGLWDATANPGAIPDGQFFSWFGQVQRIQQLSPNNILTLQLDVQLTPDSLLPSEQFVIGGGLSVRGYRQNARSGDNGIRLSIEDRIILGRDGAGAPLFQVIPFFDLGTVWNHPDNPNRLLDQQFLAGAGLGIQWNPTSRVNLRLDYGLPFVDLDDRGENAQDRGFYFTLNYRF